MESLLGIELDFCHCGILHIVVGVGGGGAGGKCSEVEDFAREMDDRMGGAISKVCAVFEFREWEGRALYFCGDFAAFSGERVHVKQFVLKRAIYSSLIDALVHKYIIEKYFYCLLTNNVVSYLHDELPFQLSLVDLLVGGYMTLIGITYIIVGKQTSQKLSELRKSTYSEEILRKKFLAADMNSCGSLSLNEFQTLMSQEFGINFSSRELEVSFNHMDGVHDRDGRVTLDEFLEWWNNCQFDEASMAEFGLSV